MGSQQRIPYNYTINLCVHGGGGWEEGKGEEEGGTADSGTKSVWPCGKALGW